MSLYRRKQATTPPAGAQQLTMKKTITITADAEENLTVTSLSNETLFSLTSAVSLFLYTIPNRDSLNNRIIMTC